MNIRTFLSRVFGHWKSAMTGGLSLPLAVTAAFAPTVSQKVGLAVLAVLAFAYASYRAWLLEFVRAETATAILNQRRPRLVPEIVERDTMRGGPALVLSNVTDIPAIGVSVELITSGSSTIAFYPIQLIKPSDGRVDVRPVPGGGGLRDQIGVIHIGAVHEAFSNGRGSLGDKFEVPLRLRYSDANGREYVDSDFALAFIVPPNRAPQDSALIVRRRITAAY